VGKEKAAGVLVSIQVLLFAAGAILTVLWIVGTMLRGSWWTNTPMIACLLGSLLVFSYEEVQLGLVRKQREKQDDPDSLGGILEGVAFTAWLFLLVNMIATVFKIIRAVKHAL
jgi:hypothetical protein